jgi:hypothetical protein
VAFITAAPPTLKVVGVAVIASEASVWDEGLLHPAIKIANPNSNPEHTRGMGDIRIHCLVNFEFVSTTIFFKGLVKGANRQPRIKNALRAGEPCCLVVCYYLRVYRIATMPRTRHE